LPNRVALQERLADPEPGILIGAIALQVRPDGTASLRVTVPENWLRPVTVIIDVPVEPTFAAAGGDAEIVKSWKLNAAVAVWVREPLVPVSMRL